jgi:hypothetical protein
MAHTWTFGQWRSVCVARAPLPERPFEDIGCVTVTIDGAVHRDDRRGVSGALEVQRRMGEVAKVQLPDGQVIWARIESADGAYDTGLSDRIFNLEGFAETLHGVATNIQTGLAGARPDGVSVAFGIELAVHAGGLVAALVGVGGQANLTITLTWDADGVRLARAATAASATR